MEVNKLADIQKACHFVNISMWTLMNNLGNFLQNAVKCCKMLQNASKCCKMLQSAANAVKGYKILQNTAKFWYLQFSSLVLDL